MHGLNRSRWVASTMILIAVLITSCEQPYSTPPVVTNTPINQDTLFATPIGIASQSPVELFGTQTAQAANPSVFLTPTASAPQLATATQTPLVSVPSTSTFIPTSTLAVPAGNTSVPAATFPPGTRPPTYTLQKEEFPFCIARRLNIDPQALLDASTLTSPDIYYAGLVLTLPQNPNSVWSVAELGPRSLRTHPATYTVTGNADTTVYGVACKFGDVTPDSIVSANSGITLGSALNVGQTLNIP